MPCKVGGWQSDDELTRAGASNPGFATEVQPLRAAFAQSITNFAALVERIREAHHESQRTQEVIGIIESFAFQTNILALNAAVEAARAGEQGRGFAVVAAEVRNLAQRSAQATHEIKQLLSNSLLNSKASLDIVEDTGAQIDAVVSSVRQTTETMRDIASACAEQASSIAQVTAAISQMDRITQLNAALVQRHVAAAQTLDQQAAQLSTAVSRFTTGHQATQ